MQSVVHAELPSKLYTHSLSFSQAAFGSDFVRLLRLSWCVCFTFWQTKSTSNPFNFVCSLDLSPVFRSVRWSRVYSLPQPAHGKCSNSAVAA